MAPKFVLRTSSRARSRSLVLLWLLIETAAPFAACCPLSLGSTAAVPRGRGCSVAMAGKGHVALQALQYECKGWSGHLDLILPGCGGSLSFQVGSRNKVPAPALKAKEAAPGWLLFLLLATPVSVGAVAEQQSL